jgi:SAM-dependent methyltransferase
MSVFNLYAAYYDLLYRDKDYAQETDYVAGLIAETSRPPRELLELGCGTGGHAVQFAERGIQVHGIDLSADMVQRASDRIGRARTALEALPSFEQGDVRSYRANRTFDAVVSLFHVASYQTSNADQDELFGTARAHLCAAGVFVFDFWYGPAVLTDRPRHVTKQAEDEHIEVSRETTPTMFVNDNCVDVRFDVHVRSKSDQRSQRIVENHRMRYLFLPEIEQRLGASRFRLLRAYAWMSRLPLSDRSWYGCVVAQAC